jgi:hypothetical protein
MLQPSGPSVFFVVIILGEAVDIESGVMLEADTLIMHDLELVQAGGKRVNVGIFIPSKAEAAWLAQRMRNALEGR